MWEENKAYRLSDLYIPKSERGLTVRLYVYISIISGYIGVSNRGYKGMIDALFIVIS